MRLSSKIAFSCAIMLATSAHFRGLRAPSILFSLLLICLPSGNLDQKNHNFIWVQIRASSEHRIPRITKILSFRVGWSVNRATPSEEDFASTRRRPAIGEGKRGRLQLNLSKKLSHMHAVKQRCLTPAWRERLLSLLRRLQPRIPPYSGVARTPSFCPYGSGNRGHYCGTGFHRPNPTRPDGHSSRNTNPS